MAAKLVLTVTGLCVLVHDKTVGAEELHLLLVDARTHNHMPHTPRLLFNASAYEDPPSGWEPQSWTDLAGNSVGSIELDKDVLSFGGLRAADLYVSAAAPADDRPFPWAGSEEEQSLHWVVEASSLVDDLHVKPSAIMGLDGVVARLTLDRGTARTLQVHQDPRKREKFFHVWDFKIPGTNTRVHQQALALSVQVEIPVDPRSDLSIYAHDVAGVEKSKLTLASPDYETSIHLALTNLPNRLMSRDEFGDHFRLFYDVFDKDIAWADRPQPDSGPFLGTGGPRATTGSLCPLIKDTQP